jgi:DNA-binding NtrC family response regulator
MNLGLNMGSSKPGILIVDDEFNMRHILSKVLSKKNYNVKTADSAEKALELYSQNTFEVVITDLVMPKMDGLSLLEHLRAIDNSVIVVVITGKSTIDSAIKAIKLGAYDYLSKPFEVSRIELIIEKALKQKHLIEKADYLWKNESEKSVIIGESDPIKEIFKLIEQVSVADSTVLINGAPGTGKELIARAIHASSKRSSELFVPVNCAALTETLLESELFGHEKGSFTGAVAIKKGLFEIASGGTLFLDEIGEISRQFQVKLLRVLQESEFKRVGGVTNHKCDVRIIAATNKNLVEEVNKSNFRQDLFFRLNVFPIDVPPLKERKEDIPILANFFVKKLAERMKKNIKGVSEYSLEILKNYNWPGNVRELENIIERAVILENTDYITPASIKSIRSNFMQPESEDEKFYHLNFKDAKAMFEKKYISYHLGRDSENMTRLAKKIGIHRTTLYEMVRNYDLEV